MCPHTSSPHPRLGKQFTSYKPQTRSSSKEKTVVWKQSGIMWITEFPNKQLFFSSVYCWCSGFGFFFTFSSPPVDGRSFVLLFHSAVGRAFFSLPSSAFAMTEEKIILLPIFSEFPMIRKPVSIPVRARASGVGGRAGSKHFPSSSTQYLYSATTNTPDGFGE